MAKSASISQSPGLTHHDGGGYTGRGKGAGSVTEDSSRDAWLQQARSYLRHADPVLAWLIDDQADFDPRGWMAQLPPMDLYGALLFQVTGQQLSVPATRRTLARIQALFGGHLPAPAELLAVDPGTLRGSGCRGGRSAWPGTRLSGRTNRARTGTGVTLTRCCSNSRVPRRRPRTHERSDHADVDVRL
jgi:hypothetical protein